MKKFLTLLLTFFCCISLASCSLITGNNKPTEIRTTITLDEWIAIGKSNNFSIFFNFSPGATILKHADNRVVIEMYNPDGSNEIAESYVNTNGVLYTIEKADKGYIASKSDDNDLNSLVTGTLADTLSLGWAIYWNSIYYKLLYIEECKTYITAVQNSPYNETIQIEVECENGQIKEMRLCNLDRDYNDPMPGIVTFYNFDKTVAEIPEYTFAD